LCGIRTRPAVAGMVYGVCVCFGGLKWTPVLLLQK